MHNNYKHNQHIQHKQHTQNIQHNQNNQNKSTQLTIKYLINLLNDQKNLTFDKINYLIDSYPTIKLDSIISYDLLLSGIMIAYKNISYKLNNTNFKVFLDDEIIKLEKQKIEKFIFNSTIESGKKKKYLTYITSQTATNSSPLNENILLLTYYYGINLIIYNSDTQTTKCFYYDNYLDRDLPFIVIKEVKDQNSPNLFYEISFSQNQYIFNYNHPIIAELIPNAFIIGLEQNKRLEYLPFETKNNLISESNNNETNNELNNTIESNNELNNTIESNDIIKSGFQEFISCKKEIILKPIPHNINKLINELQTTNYKYL